MKDNLPNDYLCVRVQVVHVQKGRFGFKDTIMGFRSVIPNTTEEAANLGSHLFNVCDETTKRLKLVDD